MDIFSRLAKNRILYFSLAATVLFAVSFLINFNGYFAVIDPDGYYHIRHAWLYRTNSIFDTSFPWTQYSVTRTLGGDLWYGFHIFLIPFTFFNDLVWGIKMAGVAITFAALLMYFFAIHRLKLRLSLFWPAILPLFSYSLLQRFAVTRPHPLSVGLNILIFSFLVTGGVWPVFVFSFLAAFIHLNLFWVPILTLIIISIIRVINKQLLEKNKAIAMFSGIVAGALLRPHPIATLKLNYIQLVDLMIQKIKGLKLAFGFELFPLGLFGLPLYILITFIVLVLLFVWLAKKHLSKVTMREKITMLTLMVLTTFYLILSIFVMGRAIDFFISFLLLFAAFNLTFYFNYELNEVDKRIHGLAKAVIVASVMGLACFNAIRLLGQFDKYLSSEANPYGQEASLRWIEKVSKPGEIIFHLGWARFPQLFFWDQYNHYISAMDPIFLFTYNSSLYWESHFLSTGEGGEYTCSQRRCTKEETIKTDVVLRQHFGASYVYITALKGAWPELFYYLVFNPKKYERIFLDQEVAIFKVIY